MTENFKDNKMPLSDKIRSWAKRFNLEESAILINIPQVPMEYLEKEVAIKRGYFAYHPHSLLYLAACFRKLGIKREVIDLNYEVLRGVQDGESDLTAFWKNILKKEIDKHESPLICVSFMFEATKPMLIEVCTFLRETYPDHCIWTGGVNATADPEQLLLNNYADAVFVNEGEQSLDEFYRFIRNETDEIPCNLIFRDANGEILKTTVKNGGPVDIDILDEYDLIDTKNYHKAGSISNFSRMNGLEIPFAAVLAKRGCRARCGFCGVRNFNGAGVRLREPNHVVDEMIYLREKFGIEHFDWLDDDLLMNKTYTLNLFNDMIDRIPGVTWAANNGLIASSITPELYDAFRASGCIGFKVGLESGNPEMLKKVHKPTNVKQFLNFAKLAQDYLDIWVSVNFIIGLPEERFEQMRDSLELSIQSRLHWHNYYIYQHLKNTEFYITFGGMGDDYISKEHGKENSRPAEKSHSENFVNPVRQGGFKQYKGVPSGWEIFDIDPKFIPPRSWINEIWFTFNSIGNFILNPCIDGDSDVLLRDTIKWLGVLGDAYPQDASMQALRYFLLEKQGEMALKDRVLIKDRAADLFKSTYWTNRDKTFHFSAFLENDRPKLPKHLENFYDLQKNGLNTEMESYTQRVGHESRA